MKPTPGSASSPGKRPGEAYAKWRRASGRVSAQRLGRLLSFFWTIVAFTAVGRASDFAEEGFAEFSVATNLTGPSALAATPDGRILVAQQGGVIRVIKDDALLATPFATLTVDGVGERGLLGIAVDPNFATNHFVYVYYTATSPASHNRLSRVTANGDVMLAGSEQILLNLPNANDAYYHMGGAIQFGPDGKIYLSVGEHSLGTTNSQSMTVPFGKILRLNADGSAPTNNPFYTASAGWHQYIWALGLRNPFTTAVQPGSGLFYINDVGDGNWEEINAGAAGANYGWPDTEGDFNQSFHPGFTRPIYAYPHNPGCAITGGAFYNPASVTFPAFYTGRYFFVDFCTGNIWTLDTGTHASLPFSTGAVFPIGLIVAPGGSLYYISRGEMSTGGAPSPGAGAVYKIEYAANTQPSIVTPPANRLVAVGQSAMFTVSASGTPPLTYQWQRETVDIPGAEGISYTLPSAALADSGAHFRCVVSNGFGDATSSAAVLTVTTNPPPAPVIATPAAGTTYVAGTTINFSGSASDPTDGALAASALTWQVDFHHDSHAHPFYPATSGIASGSFFVPTTGETSPNVWYRIYLTATNSAGLSSTVYRDITPVTALLTLRTVPSGLTLRLDGTPFVAPLTVSGVAGMTRHLQASGQIVRDVPYDFSAWSDAGAAEHDIVFPSSNTTITSSFQTSALIPRAGWSVLFVDSEETAGEPAGAANAIDGNLNSFWHTVWSSGPPSHPHEIQIDMGASYSVNGFRYLPRQGNDSGWIGEYDFYVSANSSNWGAAVASGEFPVTSAEQQVLFTPKTGRYVRLVAHTALNNGPYTSVAELNVLQVGLAIPAPLRLLCLGDSITQGGNGMVSYRDPLIRVLDGENVNGANPAHRVYALDFIGTMTGTFDDNPVFEDFPNSLKSDPQHEGHGGWQANHILSGKGDSGPTTGSGTLSDWLATYTPDIVLLHIGTNDALVYADAGGASNDPNFTATTRSEIGAIIDLLREDNPDVLVYLAKIIPGDYSTKPTSAAAADWQAATEAINGFIDSLAAEKNAAAGTQFVWVVDQHFNFNVGSMLNDFAHPNAAGEAFIAVNWYNSVKPVLEVFSAPNGTIDSPATNRTIAVGGTLTFAGTASDPDDNLPLTYLWNFGGAGPANSTVEDPGSVQFNTAGNYTVTFTVTDSQNQPDLSPATRSITVSQAPNGTISSPAANATIAVGQSLNFAGTGNDPDGNTPLTYYWNFGAGSGIPDSTAQNPGNLQFNLAGTFTVTLTVTDALGVADPTPATRVITVSKAPNGTIDLPAAASVEINVGQSVTFAGTGSDPDGNTPLSYLWNFGGAGPANSTAEDPGAVQFNQGGAFTVTFTVTDALGVADPTPATRTVTVGQSTATVNLSNLTQTFDGAPKSATATTNPPGLTVDITYDGSATAPTVAGDYAVVATVNDPNYTGSATGTLVIQKAAGSVSLGNLSQTYNGTPRKASATTTPSGLNVVITYDGSPTAPTNAGSYAVVATIDDNNYSGTASGALVIAKATAGVTLSNLSQTYNGTPRSASATTTPPGLSVSFTYNGSGTAPTNAGNYAVVATVNDANYAGTASDTLVVAKAAATVSLGNLIQGYDGQPKSATATTTPAGLAVSFTYDGSSTAPTAIGSYAVVGTINDTNYAGSASGTLVVAQVLTRINAGGGNYTDTQGRVWSADAGFNTGSTYTTSATISGATDGTIYKSERYDSAAAPELVYGFNVTNGDYAVRLHFAEINPATAAVGRRVFDVLVEGQLALDNLDVFAAAGFNAALVRTIPVTVTDGVLNVGFAHVTENPIISALEVLVLSVDTQPPSAPGNLQGNAPSTTQVNLTWSAATDNVGVAGYVVFRNGLQIASPTGLSYTDNGRSPGTQYDYSVVARDAAGNSSPPAAVSVTTPAVSAIIRVNAGGGAFVDSHANNWAADTGFNTGSVFSTGAAIAGTVDDPIYQTQRYDPVGGAELAYAFAVPNGNYQVSLHFAEIYSGTAGVGKRVFDVLLEGQLALDDLDIFSQAGFNAALVRTLPVTVSDGQLNIAFAHGVKDNPTISGIEVFGPIPDNDLPTTPANLAGVPLGSTAISLSWNASTDNIGVTGYEIRRDGNPIATISQLSYTDSNRTPGTSYSYEVRAKDAAGNASPPASVVVATLAEVRVNAAGAVFTDGNGKQWSADTGFNTGSTFTTTSAIAGTTDDVLYQSQRYDAPGGSELAYAFSAPNGNYTVRLHFAEIYSGTAGVGKRVFNVAIEGQTVLTNFDVFAQGGFNTAVVRSFPITITDGQVNIGFVHVTQNPIISAIELVPVTDTQAPSTPGNLAATAVTATQVQLTWSAATDNVGVTSYRIRRNGVLLAQVPGLAFTDNTATAFTSYTYEVIAEDNAGNASAPASVAVATSAIRINSGGPTYVDGSGNTWVADTGFNTGSTYSTAAAIAGTTLDPLYQVQRYDPPDANELTYSFAVPNATYTVKLHFAEIYSGTVGQRVFDVLAEGVLALDHLDVVQQAGFNTALVKTIPVTVTDGQLNLSFVHRANNPMVSAIEVLSAP